MLWHVARYLAQGRVAYLYTDPEFHFPYEWFAAVPPVAMEAVFVGMGLALVGLTLGRVYRLASWAFFLLYTYSFVVEKTLYNNHYYLICLLGFLFCLCRADRWGSWGGCKEPVVARWELYLFRFQILVVYVFGGIAKLNGDWLQGQPMEMWLRGQTDLAYALSYGGLLLDLLLAPLVLHRACRPWILAALALFHLSNSVLFTIGVFPPLMIATTVLFLEPETLRKLFRQESPTATLTDSLKTPMLALLTVYLALQILVPLRHHLYRGNASWTEEGHRFSWRMKLRQKKADFGIRVEDKVSGQQFRLNPEDHLTGAQIQEMASRPDMIVQYCRHLHTLLSGQGMSPKITVDTSAALNGRPAQPLIEPGYDLGSVNLPWYREAPYIVPLRQVALEREPPPWLEPALLALLLFLVGLSVPGWRSKWHRMLVAWIHFSQLVVLGLVMFQLWSAGGS